MATHIKVLIKKFLKEQKKTTRQHSEIRRVIKENLDRTSAKNLVVEGVHKNTLIIRSSSSSFVYDFNLKKEGILEALQKELPCLKEIKIKVG